MWKCDCYSEGNLLFPNETIIWSHSKSVFFNSLMVLFCSTIVKAKRKDVWCMTEGNRRRANNISWLKQKFYGLCNITIVVIVRIHYRLFALLTRFSAGAEAARFLKDFIFMFIALWTIFHISLLFSYGSTNFVWHFCLMQ